MWAIVIAIPLCHYTHTHTDLNQPGPLYGAHSAATLGTDGNEQLTTKLPIFELGKPKVLKCTRKVLGNRSTLEMYLSTSTSTLDFSQLYSSTFRVLYKLYLSTDVLKYKVLLPGFGQDDRGEDRPEFWVIRLMS